MNAQQPNSASPAEQKEIEEAFKRSKKQAVFGACNRSAPIKDARQRSTACTCYSDAYVNRYKASTLSLINQWSTKNPDKRGIIVLMLTPERRMCKIP